ncbi:S8 family serine peptidase [Lachnospira pectinoschiza]|uniref:S8 family peptidase n=1 Tax=Lachnospira pectinoschiza TaxID=28052 RepID=UPI001D085CD4|nr:S8 family peptidase [Lachnospira pectinoschiza]MCB6143942.1 S8 family serine peptidase [Lachnospira pectinoschiza]
MADQKLENLLNISLQATKEEREKSEELGIGYDPEQNTWELIVRYTGSLDGLRTRYPQIRIRELLNQYAVLIVPETLVDAVSQETVIEYVEKPKQLYFELQAGKAASCINAVQQGMNNPFGLFGKGTIVAVIDTGIRAESMEFRNADGSTRILNIWDQTTGTEYDRSQIDEVLQNETKDTAGIPGADVLGHGTQVAAIACGSSGVAAQADILVVKLGLAAKNGFPRTTQLMEALDYVVRKAIDYGKPLVVNISFGNNYGDHTGSSLLENFINDIADSWKCSICIGSGNEGLGAVHTGGTLTEDTEETVELAVSSYETGLSIQIWKDYWDDIAVEIIAPSGRNLGRIQENSRVSRIRYEDMELLTYFGEPSPFRIRQEIYIDMIPQTVYIQSGLWKLRLIPRSIRNGRYDMWLPAQGALNFGTGFTSPDSASTFTIPSAAAKAVTVGAYDAGTGSAASFSGRGYIVEIGGSLMVKPELAAPGVNVLVPSVSGMARVSGTSYATPFVTGSAALLMEWGIVRGNDAFLYGEKLKAYLIKGAEPLAGAAVPDTQTGWGRLCLKNSLPQA